MVPRLGSRYLFIRPLITLLCCLAVAACDGYSSVPPGRIRVKNDFGGEQFSTIEISGNGFSQTLKSREFLLLPAGTTSIYFRYQSSKGLRQYRVHCPYDLREGITIKLIDVHANRIAGKCETVWAEHE